MAPSTNRVSGTPSTVHFEETLEPQQRRSAIGLFIGILVVPTVIALVVVPLDGTETVVIGGAAIVIVAVLVWAAWRSLRWRATIQVTDDGVELEQRPPPLLGGDPELSIPFETMESVQVSESQPPRIHVTKADKNRGAERGQARPKAYGVVFEGKTGFAGAYDGGVRIGRSDGPPVYIGSKQPRELGNHLVEHAPQVDDMAEF